MHAEDFVFVGTGVSDGIEGAEHGFIRGAAVDQTDVGGGNAAAKARSIAGPTSAKDASGRRLQLAIMLSSLEGSSSGLIIAFQR